jgi:hypothetical protein
VKFSAGGNELTPLSVFSTGLSPDKDPNIGGMIVGSDIARVLIVKL